MSRRFRGIRQGFRRNGVIERCKVAGKIAYVCSARGKRLFIRKINCIINIHHYTTLQYYALKSFTHELFISSQTTTIPYHFNHPIKKKNYTHITQPPFPIYTSAKKKTAQRTHAQQQQQQRHIPDAHRLHAHCSLTGLRNGLLARAQGPSY